MVNINVSYAELSARANQLAAGRDEITTTLARLQGSINALVAQGFTTDKASGAFADSYNRFTSGATSAIAGLDDLAEFLRSAAQTLSDTDLAIASRASR